MLGRAIKVNSSDKINYTSTTRYKSDGNGVVNLKCGVLIENLGEPEMIPVIRALKGKDDCYWPQKDEVKRQLAQEVGKYIISNNIEAVVCCVSKSPLLKEVMDLVKYMFPQLNNLVVIFPFKKNLECDIKLNEFQVKFSSRNELNERRNFLEARNILKKLSTSKREASTSSIGRIGYRRYFYNFYGVQNELLFSRIKGFKTLFLDDSRGEWNTIFDCVPIIENHCGKQVDVLVFALDRADNNPNKKQNEKTEENMNTDMLEMVAKYHESKNQMEEAKKVLLSWAKDNDRLSLINQLLSAPISLEYKTPKQVPLVKIQKKKQIRFGEDLRKWCEGKPKVNARDAKAYLDSIYGDVDLDNVEQCLKHRLGFVNDQTRTRTWVPANTVVVQN